MTDAPVRVAVGGLGTIGSQVARLLLSHRQGIEFVGAASKDPDQIGRPVADVLGITIPEGPLVVEPVSELVALRPDALVLATGSFLPDVLEDVIACAAGGVNLVSPCEELAYPFR